MTITIRPVHTADAPQLLELASQLDTLNLPNNPVAITKLIADSEQSFAGGDPHHATYTLVAVRDSDERLLGTSSVIAYHGTPEEPHYYLRVVDQVVHSKQLNTDRPRRILKLDKDIEPWTELGGLVVHPDARGQGLGKLLVAARLLLIAMHPARFCSRLLAELLPPRRPDGSNAFWDAVGGPLTGLDYYRADLLCRSDKEFIDAFFPHEEIVVDLLPPAARELISHEGPTTTPVRSLLSRAGFTYLGTVDPFDAGPHDGAPIREILPIQRSRCLVHRGCLPNPRAAQYLVGAVADHRFAARICDITANEICIPDQDAQRIGLADGSACWAMPLDW
ncbi:MAG: GNAT family N-acetyltransferase [Planctomycetota bacterium]